MRLGSSSQGPGGQPPEPCNDEVRTVLLLVCQEVALLACTGLGENPTTAPSDRTALPTPATLQNPGGRGNDSTGADVPKATAIREDGRAEEDKRGRRRVRQVEGVHPESDFFLVPGPSQRASSAQLQGSPTRLALSSLREQNAGISSTPTPRSELPTASLQALGDADIPETPPVIGDMANRRDFSVEIPSKRPTSNGAECCVLAWIESSTGDPKLDRLWREYDEQVAQLAR